MAGPLNVPTPGISPILVGVMKKLPQHFLLGLPHLQPQGEIVSVSNLDFEILGDTRGASRVLGTLPSTSGIIALVSLARSEPHTPMENQTSILEDDCSYLANLTNKTLEDDLSNLAYYTRRASIVLDW